MAIVGKQGSAVELLLNHHADPELVDASGFNALHVAAASIGECVFVCVGGVGARGGGGSHTHTYTHAYAHTISLSLLISLPLSHTFSHSYTHVGAHKAVDHIYRITASPGTLKRITNARDQNGRSQKSAPWCIPEMVYMKPIQNCLFRICKCLLLQL
jgi:hypothetical protein